MSPLGVAGSLPTGWSAYGSDHRSSWTSRAQTCDTGQIRARRGTVVGVRPEKVGALDFQQLFPACKPRAAPRHAAACEQKRRRGQLPEPPGKGGCRLRFLHTSYGHPGSTSPLSSRRLPHCPTAVGHPPNQKPCAEGPAASRYADRHPAADREGRRGGPRRSAVNSDENRSGAGGRARRPAAPLLTDDGAASRGRPVRRGSRNRRPRSSRWRSLRGCG